MTVAHSRTARHQRITAVLGRHHVHSQDELRRLLADDGFEVTQATLSRDLDELGAVKVRAGDGRLCYAVPAEGGDPTPRPAPDTPADLGRLRRRCEDLLVSAEASANIVVLRTPPGGAPFLASAIDHTVLPAVLGTVAGDDAILLVTRDPRGGRQVAADLLALALPQPPAPDPTHPTGPTGPTGPTDLTQEGEAS
jgi:transcriptional regulator of arginine metabolism